jgi:hypothetical protein
MCSLTLALTGLTTGLSMASQYQQSRAQAAAYNAQAEAAEQNARIQERQGELIAEQHAQKQRELDNRRRLVQGAQRASAGASGIAAGSGSALDMYMATMDAWREDSVNLLENQRETIYDNYIKVGNYNNQAASYRSMADAAKTAGNWGMAGTLLGGATSMYGMKSAGSSSGSGSVYAGPDSVAFGTKAVKKINAFNNAYSGWGTANLYSPGSLKLNGGIGL